MLVEYFQWDILIVAVWVNYTLLSDTREASLLFSYAKEVSASGALDQDEKDEDIPGRLKHSPLILILLVLEIVKVLLNLEVKCLS